MEQADGNWTHRKRGYTSMSTYHRWLKKAHSRQMRRIVRQMIRNGTEPPRRLGYDGWES